MDPQVLQGVARVLDPALNLGLSVARRYTKPDIEFDATRVKDDSDERRRATEALRRAGAIVLRGFYPTAQVDATRERLERFFDDVEWRRNAPKGVKSDPRFLVQNTLNRKLSGYGACVKHSKPVINFRGGADNGLVDLFHPEKLFGPMRDEMPIVDEMKENLVRELVETAVDCPMRTTVRNVYVSDSVLSTRGYHTDGLAIKAKNFVYLTDVFSDDAGPYCYALGTHQASKEMRHANQRHNALLKLRWDDFPLHGTSRRVVFHGQRGDLILSLQYGAHRGLPQKLGSRRMVLVHTLEKTSP